MILYLAVGLGRALALLHVIRPSTFQNNVRFKTLQVKQLSFKIVRRLRTELIVVVPGGGTTIIQDI